SSTSFLRVIVSPASWREGAPAGPQPCRDGEAAQARKAPREPREVRGPQAHRGEADQRLGAFGQAAEVVDALVRKDQALETALRRECGEGEEGGGGADEAGEQCRCRQGIRGWVGDREGERDAGVEQEVGRDVEEAAAVGGMGLPCQRAVES